MPPTTQVLVGIKAKFAALPGILQGRVNAAIANGKCDYDSGGVGAHWTYFIGECTPAMQPRCSRDAAELQPSCSRDPAVSEPRLSAARTPSAAQPPPPPFLSAAAGNLIFKKVQKLLGGNVELMVTGKAP